VADQIGDGVSLPGSWRPLNEYASVSLQPLGDQKLLLVGRLAEEGIRILIYEVSKENWANAGVLGLDMK